MVGKRGVNAGVGQTTQRGFLVEIASNGGVDAGSRTARRVSGGVWLKAKQKGACGEREAAAVLNDVLGVRCRRGQQFKGTQDSPDVEGLPGFHLEVKRRERLNVAAALARCDEESAEDDIALLLHRRNREPWAVTLYLTELPLAVERLARMLNHDTLPKLREADAQQV